VQRNEGSGRPQPLVPADVDLRGYEFMPFYGHRLFGSDFNARVSDAGFRAAVALWWNAWNQVPAASLPNDEVALCRLADLGRDLKTWRKVKSESLHGFVECSDGRLYHKAQSVWASRHGERRQISEHRGNAKSSALARHRAERAELFECLREHGVKCRLIRPATLRATAKKNPGWTYRRERT
jgi:hypothetical protein